MTCSSLGYEESLDRSTHFVDVLAMTCVASVEDSARWV